MFTYFNSYPYREKRNSDQKGKNAFLFIDCLDFSFGVACEASVSNRVRDKKNTGEKGRGEEVSFSPLPLPFLPLFCSRYNFLDELARKHLLRRLFSGFCYYCCCSHLTDIVRQSGLRADAVSKILPEQSIFKIQFRNLRQNQWCC